MLTTLLYLALGILLATTIYAPVRTAVFARRVYPRRFHLGSRDAGHQEPADQSAVAAAN